jgi:3-phosphoshikimate 1-carboxyvinyltransferase
MPSDTQIKRVKIEPVELSFDLLIKDIAPDKSISHRAAMFALLSDQTTYIHNFLQGEDTLDTLHIVEQLGADVSREKGEITIVPPKEIHEPEEELYCGNAGTGMRLFCGLLSGLEGEFVLSGDKYLQNRPMKRVVEPLRSIGVRIDGRNNGNLAPLHIRGGDIKAFEYISPVDSAQVKSAMILAALKADSLSRYRENLLTRDHTERMLRGMGADIHTDHQGWIEIHPAQEPLNPLDITVPADPSSGFFFAVAAAIVPNSRIVIKNVSLNPTRIEAYRVLKEMGANIEYIEKENQYEPTGDISVTYNGKLNAVDVNEKIAWLIDELPALSIAMAQAEGKSTVKNAAELRVKESDRISSVLTGLNNTGIVTEEFEDGYAIVGGKMSQAVVDSFGDHRVAMSFSIAGLICGMEIKDTACVETSFPNFYTLLEQITKVKT